MSHKLFIEFDDDVFNHGDMDFFSSSSTVESRGNNSSEGQIIFFDRLKEEYLKIIKISDYERIQEKLYASKSNREIIEFEIVRIRKNYSGDLFISERLVDVEKLLKMYGDEIPDDVYDKVVNLIIKLELSVGMKIGLFKELCSLYEKEKLKNLKNKNLSYVKKK